VDAIFEEALLVMERAFRRLEGQVPPPKPTPLGNGFVLRYREQLIEQAIVQKLARSISSLAASRALLHRGFVQEQAVLHRILDELAEDICFLVAAVTNDETTELHARYLRSFWAEEFEDPDDIVGSSNSRDIIPRKKIRAYLSRVLGDGVNPSYELEVGDAVSKFFSGFVHGASPPIMDMCGGVPPKFHLFGMLGTPRIEEHRHDSWNYFYRTLVSLAAAAKAFGDKTLVEQLYDYMDLFEKKTGRHGGTRGTSAT
jgi:hypothetical protein